MRPWAFGVCAMMMGSAAFAWESEQTFEQTKKDILSAFSVATKQAAVASNQLQDMKVRSTQMLSVALGAISMSGQVRSAINQFDTSTGQPNSIKCDAQYQTTVAVESDAQSKRDANRLMATFAAGRLGDAMAAEKDRAEARKGLYCSVDESKQGVCELSPNGMQSWDSNYGGAFGEATLSPEGELAGYAYIATVADVRASSSIDCKSVACEAAQVKQLAVAATNAMAASALVNQVTMRRVPVLSGQ